MVTTRSGKKRGKNMKSGEEIEKVAMKVVKRHYQRRRILNSNKSEEHHSPPLSSKYQPSEAVMAEVAVSRDPATVETILCSAGPNVDRTPARREGDIASNNINNSLENGVSDGFQRNNHHQSMSLSPKPWQSYSVLSGSHVRSNGDKISVTVPTMCATPSHEPEHCATNDNVNRLMNVKQERFAYQLSTRMIERLAETATTDSQIEHWIDEAPSAADRMRNPGRNSSLVQRMPHLEDRHLPNYSTSQPSEAATSEVAVCRDPASVQTILPETVNTSLCYVSPDADNISSRRETDIAANNVSNGHQQKSMSMNLTEFAEQCDDEESEVDSVRGDSSLICIRGYRVKPEYVIILTSILSKHGDVGAECSLGSVCFRSFSMEKLCDIIQQLTNTSIGVITESEIENMLVSVSDIGNTGIEVGWIKERLNAIFEAKKAMPLLRSTSQVKQLYAERKNRISQMKAQLEIYKTYYAAKQAEALECQNKICAVHSDISAVENEAQEVQRVIKESRDKLRKVWELGSLVSGLLET